MALAPRFIHLGLPSTDSYANVNSRLGQSAHCASSQGSLQRLILSPFLKKTFQRSGVCCQFCRSLFSPLWRKTRRLHVLFWKPGRIQNGLCNARICKGGVPKFSLTPLTSAGWLKGTAWTRWDFLWDLHKQVSLAETLPCLHFTSCFSSLGQPGQSAVGRADNCTKRLGPDSSQLLALPKLITWSWYIQSPILTAGKLEVLVLLITWGLLKPRLPDDTFLLHALPCCKKTIPFTCQQPQKSVYNVRFKTKMTPSSPPSPLQHTA